MTYGALVVLQPLIDRSTGSTWRSIRPEALIWRRWRAVLLGGVIAGLLPAWRAYRLSLADGMTVRT